jgi:ferredoxin
MEDRMAAASRAVYERLARALDGVPNGYPSTASGVEIDLLIELFPRELADVASVMEHGPLTLAEIALRAGTTELQARARLDELAAFSAAKRVVPVVGGGAAAGHGAADGAAALWRLGPFWPGIWDALVPTMSRRAAELMDRYMAEGGARGIMGAEPPIGRVLPASDATRADWILPYDDVRRVIEQTAAVSISDCVCRLDRATVGRPCRYPTHNCMILHDDVPQEDEGLVTKEEALGVLAEADRIGLVHIATNVAGGWAFVCNCCGCCCHFLRGLTEWDVENVVVSDYEAAVDAAACSGCGTCAERCQIGAISVRDGGDGAGEVAVVDAEHCIGCGACVTGCPSEAVTLRRLPAARVTAPPADLEAWGDERLLDRRRR